MTPMFLGMMKYDIRGNLMDTDTDLQEIVAATSAFSQNKELLRALNKLKAKDYDSVENFLDEKEWSSKDIVRVLKIADDAYYNDGTEYELTPKQLEIVQNIFTDELYDSMFDYLKEYYPRNPYLKKIGAPKTKAKGKVELPFYMGSQDKIKPADADAWLAAHPGPYFVTDKEDGNSGGFVSDGKSIQLYSRGDGRMGQLISHLVPHIKNFPKKLPKLQGRGELIMSDAKFKAYAGEKANARNHVAGIANSVNVNKAIKDVDFLAYELIKPRMKPSDQFKELKRLGFTTPWGKVFKTLDSEKLSRLLEQRKEESPYAIDGLVVTLDKVNPVNTSGNPKYSVAFKMTSKESVVTATVIGVKWQLSKHGYLKPVVQIEPVKLSGVTVKQATGFNAGFIFENKIGKGAQVRLTRSGDVIPHILDVVKPARKPDMPRDIEFEWTDSGVDIFVPNANELDDFQITRITNFFRVLGVRDVSSGIIARLYDAGMNTIPKIIKASLRKLKTAEGIQDRKAETIRSQIDSAIKGCKLNDLMYASGCFSRELGDKRFEIICKALPRVLNMTPASIEAAVLKLPGFSSKTTSAFVKGLPEFKKFLKSLPDSVTYVIPKEGKKVSDKLSGLFICFTGFRDIELAELVKANGAVYSDSMSGRVNILVVKSASSTSSKIKEAERRGIQILNRDDFVRYLKKMKVM